MQTDEGAGAAGAGAAGAGAAGAGTGAGEHAPSFPPIDPPIPLASTTDEAAPPAHPALESGSVLRWMKEDLLSIERVGVMCNKNNNHWILLVATGIANLTKDSTEKCVISTLDSFNGDNSYEACVFREFLKMYIHRHTGRTITDDLFIIYKVIVPRDCIQRDYVNCGIYLGIYLVKLFDPTFSIQRSVEVSKPERIVSTRRKLYEFLCNKHQENIDTGKYDSEFYNVHSIDNDRNFVPHDEVPADETCVIWSASDLNGRDTVNIGLRELARVNPLYEAWLNDTIVQYLYFNKLNLRQNKRNLVFRCLSTYFITRMMRESRLDRSQCGYTTATAPSSVTMSANGASCTNSRSVGSCSLRNVSYGPFPDPDIVDELIQHQENDDFVRKQREKAEPYGHCKTTDIHEELKSTINNIGASLSEMLDDVGAFSASSLAMKNSSKEYLEKSFGEQTPHHISMPGLSDDIQLSTGAQLAKEAQKKIQDQIDGKLPRKRPREDDNEEEEAKKFCMDIVARNGFGHLL